MLVITLKPFPNFFTRCIAFLTQSNRLRTNSKLSLGLTTNVWCECVASGRPTNITFFLDIIWIFLCLFSFPVGSFVILILWSSLFLCYHRILLSSLPRFSVLYSVFPLSYLPHVSILFFCFETKLSPAFRTNPTWRRSEAALVWWRTWLLGNAFPGLAAAAAWRPDDTKGG